MTELTKLPVTVITGFLGSGKTTLIRHLMQNAGGKRLAVVVNEFGDVGVDGEILKNCFFSRFAHAFKSFELLFLDGVLQALKTVSSPVLAARAKKKSPQHPAWHGTLSAQCSVPRKVLGAFAFAPMDLSPGSR